METFYTIGDAASELGVPASTLRFYEKKGLLPHLGRTPGGIRMFTEDDLEWVRFVERLKDSGMPLGEIRRFVDLYLAGDATIEERRQIIHARRDAIDEEIRQLELARDFITYKCWFYDTASERGTCDVPRNMPDDELPPKIRAIKRRCRISRY